MRTRSLRWVLKLTKGFLVCSLLEDVHSNFHIHFLFNVWFDGGQFANGVLIPSKRSWLVLRTCCVRVSQSRGAGKCAKQTKKTFFCAKLRNYCIERLFCLIFITAISYGIIAAWETKKIEKVNERGLRYVYKDKTSTYQKLLKRVGLETTLENRRVEDMLMTINASFLGTAPVCIKELVKIRSNKYD